MTYTLQHETPVGPVTITATGEAVTQIRFGTAVPEGSAAVPETAATPLLAEGEGARTVATQFATLLAKGFAVEPALADGTGVAGAIRFAIDPARDGAGAESYLLEVTPDGATT